ncbi:benzoate-CoA ligase family protein [Rhodococcus aerolatus]
MAQGFNAAAWLVDRRVAAGDGDRVAFRGAREVTYAGLADEVAAAAAGLRALGLRRDDRVVLVCSDSAEMAVTILAAFRAGVVAVPVSTMLGAGELAAVIGDCGARVVVCSPEFADAVAAAVTASPEVTDVVRTGPSLHGLPDGVTQHAWADRLGSGDDGPGDDGTGNDGADDGCAATGDDDWALWLYTSGTTGTPKAAMHRHANIRHVCETYGAHTLGTRPDDVCFSVAKLFFAYGIGNSLFFPLAVGASALLEPRRPTPGVVAEQLVAHRPTLFFGPPTFYAALVAAELPRDTFASVRLATSAGEPLPAQLQARVEQRYGFPVLDGIGATEALHVFLSCSPDDIRPGTTGKPVPGYDVELRDESGAVVPAGTPGSLFVRGASLALGYWRRTDATREVFQGEWLRTGDSYVQDSDGYYRCLGRSNDLLKAGGIWVSPAEVESRLVAHDGVSEAAVIGVADADGLVKPVACVVRSAAGADLTEADLVDWCRAGLASFKRPRAVVFVDDLPKTATGKIQRFRLREHYADADLASLSGGAGTEQASGVPAAAQLST